MKRPLRALLGDAAAILAAILVSLVVAEAAVRLKNASMTNYDIEIWRYALELTRPSADPRIGHEHIPNAHAILQSVSIRTNQWGLRGGPITDLPAAGTRRILFLGDSQTLGWGVDEQDTMTAALQRRLAKDGQKVEVLNGGVGNYDTGRAVELFLNRLAPLHPSDVVLVMTPQGITTLGDGTKGNFLVRHSELAAMAWLYLRRPTQDDGADGAAPYRARYRPDAPEWLRLSIEVGKLADYAHGHGIRLTMVILPAFGYLPAYPFGFAHEAMDGLAERLGVAHVDLLPRFAGMSFDALRVMPGDFHFNAKAHAMIADALYPALAAPTR